MDTIFLKELTILYVDNDSSELQEFFELYFSKVYICENGKEALEKYINHKNSIDIIVSNIDIPIMNGIEFLTKIRQYSKDIPFILIDTKINQKYLIESISLKINDFFIKPIDINELLSRIIFLLKKTKKEKELKYYEEMINDYLETINKIAIVFMFDSNKKIIYINDFYKEISKFENYDILDNNFSFLYHQDIPKSFIDNQWKQLCLSRKWNGSLKFKTKDNKAFYTNCTVIPIKKNNENRYISINFITTKEENERRKFKKKVLYNFQETRKINKIAKEKIDFLNYELSSYKNYDKKSEELNNIIESNNNYLNNIERLEIKLKEIRNRQERFTSEVNLKIKEISQTTNRMKEFIKKSDKSIISLKKEVKIRENYILKIKEELKRKRQRVVDLEDVLNHRNSQLDNMFVKDNDSDNDFEFEDILAKD